MSSTTGDTPPSGARDVQVRRRRYAEAKDGFKTSEFYVTAVFVAGVLLATYLDVANLSRIDGWRYATFVAIAYIISRGLAKLGARQPSHNDD